MRMDTACAGREYPWCEFSRRVKVMAIAPWWGAPVAINSLSPALIPSLPPHVRTSFPVLPSPLSQRLPRSFTSFLYRNPAPSGEVLCFFSPPPASPVPVGPVPPPRLPLRLPWPLRVGGLRLRVSGVSTAIGIDDEIFPSCRGITGLSCFCVRGNACHAPSHSLA